jgi:hypothetical protein
MFDKILIILGILILNCGAKIYDAVNDVWIHDNIYLLTSTDMIKLTYEEFLEHTSKNVVSPNKHVKKLVKRGMPTFYSYHDEYEFELHDSLVGHNFPIIGSHIIDCNVSDGCTRTITETVTVATSLSLGGDVTGGIGKTLTEAILGSIKFNVGHTIVDTATTTLTDTWKLKQGDVGSIGIYPLTRFTHGLTTKLKICESQTGFIKCSTIEKREAPIFTTILTPQKDEKDKLLGIVSFFYK